MQQQHVDKALRQRRRQLRHQLECPVVQVRGLAEGMHTLGGLAGTHDGVDVGRRGACPDAVRKGRIHRPAGRGAGAQRAVQIGSLGRGFDAVLLQQPLAQSRPLGIGCLRLVRRRVDAQQVLRCGLVRRIELAHRVGEAARRRPLGARDVAGGQAAQVVHRQRVQTVARGRQPRLVVRARHESAAVQQRRSIQRRRLAPARFVGALHRRQETQHVDVDARAHRRRVELHPVGADLQALAELAAAQRAQRIQRLAQVLPARRLAHALPQQLGQLRCVHAAAAAPAPGRPAAPARVPNACARRCRRRAAHRGRTGAGSTGSSTLAW